MGRFFLSAVLLCCLLVITGEFLFFAWVVKQEIPKVANVSFGDIAFFVLACLLSLVPLALVVLGRSVIFEWLYRWQLSLAEKVWGASSKAAARASLALAECLTESERYDEAETLYKRVIAANAQSGVRISSTFNIQTELSYLNFLRKSDRMENAPGITPYLVELEKRYRPYDYTSKTLYGLALIFAFLSTAILILDWAAATSTLAGNYGLAKEICELTPAAPPLLPALKVGGSIELLARGYSEGAQWSKAVPLYKTLLEIREVRDGANSPAAAEVMQLLSEAYLNQGKYGKAQHLLEQALLIYKDAANPDDPRIAVILNDLAAVYANDDKFDESQQLLKKALTIYEKHRRPKDPGAADSLHRLAVVCSEKGQYKQAEPLYKLALAVSEESYGPNDLRVASTLSDYADFLRKTGHQQQARKAEARARIIRSFKGASRPGAEAPAV
jgi:tetratricopeptide (TPR) repeat protein